MGVGICYKHMNCQMERRALTKKYIQLFVAPFLFFGNIGNISSIRQTLGVSFNGCLVRPSRGCAMFTSQTLVLPG